MTRDANLRLCPTCHAQWVGDGLRHAVNWEADHQRRMLEHHGLAEEFPYECDSIDAVAEALLVSRAEVSRLRKLLCDLANAAEAFAAEQSYAAHSSCGVVQPVTVAECEALNAALRAATEALSMELSNARSD